MGCILLAQKIKLLWDKTPTSRQCVPPEWNVLHLAAHDGNRDSVRNILETFSVDDLRRLWYDDRGGNSPIDIIANDFKQDAQDTQSFEETINFKEYFKK